MKRRARHGLEEREGSWFFGCLLCTIYLFRPSRQAWSRCVISCLFLNQCEKTPKETTKPPS